MLDIGSVTASVCIRKALSAYMVSSLRRIGVFPSLVQIVLINYTSTVKAALLKMGYYIGN
jgi:hypothetical protein